MTDKQLARRVAAAHERLIATIKRCATLIKDAEDGLAVEVKKAMDAGLYVGGSLISAERYSEQDPNFLTRYLSQWSSGSGLRVSRTVDLIGTPNLGEL